MPEHKLTKKRVKRTLKRTLSALALVIALLLLWVVLSPMLASGKATTYLSYTVETGDIATERSFSATLSVKKSETFSASETSTVRSIYVQSGDTVKKGDQLMQLSTGDIFTASFDGVINEIRVKTGDWLWPNFPVVQVSDLEHLEVSMDVDEYDVENLSVGQSCTVRVISLGVEFETMIAHINRVSQSTGTVAYYSVACDLTVPETILPGMQATVTVPAQEVLGVTTVSMAALAFDAQEAPYVLLKDESGAYVEQPIEIGISDGMKVEVLNGLTPGQTVYAANGEESAQASITLTDIYTYLFGKKTVINDMTNAGSGQMPDFSATGGQMPDFDAADGQMPDFSAAGGQMPSDSLTGIEDVVDATTTDTAAATVEPAATGEPEADADATGAQAQTSDTPAEGGRMGERPAGGPPDGQMPQGEVPTTQPTETTDGEGAADAQ